MRSWLFLFLVFLVPFVLADPCEENQQQQCGTTAIGACTYGIQICQGGQWSICYGSIDPVDEVCDNHIDDDCDGQIDESCLCIADEQRACTGNSVGICQPGFQTCINGTQWSSCFNQTLPLANDLCNNNLDDDCDGQIDEGCQVQQQNQTSQTNCFNNMQDGDETGVDCGGSCRSCGTCTDGILNQGEYKTGVDIGDGTVSDCGGPNCPSCPTCSDNIKNQGEQQVDCGGPCQACQRSDQEDIDQDGLTLTLELQKGTDSTLKDTDGDGIDDKQDRMPLCPNTVCDSGYGEDEQTCPEDCATSSTASLAIALLILFMLLVVIGGYLLYQFKKSTKTMTSKKTKEPEQPLYIDKGLLETESGKNQKTKIDKDLEKSFEKVEKLFK